MQPAVVEPVDVFKDRELELGAGLPHAVFDQLRLERVDKRFGHRVIKRVTDRPDRPEQGYCQMLWIGGGEVSQAATFSSVFPS